jgi:DNA-binding CsgD family transcriptional regulator
MDESFGTEPKDEGASPAAPTGGADRGKDAGTEARKPRKKPKLTDETQAEICAMISVGCSLRTAARLAGCSEAAIRNLKRRDRAFAKRFREASIRREVFPLRAIINASQTRWRAAAWFLSRLNPAEYGYRKPEAVSPEALRDWSLALAGAIREVVEDDATLARILEVFNRLVPKKDRREEMQSVTMPPGYDANAESEGGEFNE